jgi:hypothetical protein
LEVAVKKITLFLIAAIIFPIRTLAWEGDKITIKNVTIISVRQVSIPYQITLRVLDPKLYDWTNKKTENKTGSVTFDLVICKANEKIYRLAKTGDTNFYDGEVVPKITFVEHSQGIHYQTLVVGLVKPNSEMFDGDPEVNSLKQGKYPCDGTF